MILRIVLGRLPSAAGADALVEIRSRLARAALDIGGLESLIVGARRRLLSDETGDASVEAAFVTVWRDVESMSRSIGTDDRDHLLAERIGLSLAIDQATHYEIVGRTFAALPPETSAHLRFLTIRAQPNEESTLMDVLRVREQRLVELGLVASHIGRRVVGSVCEAVTVAVWPDRATIDAATGGGSERALFEQDLARWSESLHLETYDGVEIAHRLPKATGPAIFIMDDDLRIVDIAPAAAAALGREPDDIAGRTLHDLSRTDPTVFEGQVGILRHQGTVLGEARWHVPATGEVLLRYAARRDAPIEGRHTVLLRRWSEAAPTEADLDAAIAAAFPRHEEPAAS